MDELDESVIPNRPSRCTWSKDADPATSPHTKRPQRECKKVMSSVLDAIGYTPLIRLNKIPKSEGVKCDIMVKCEFMNPGGSVKDRIGQRMIEDAEAKGLLKPGSTIIELTSGNTGIAVAMVAAVKGYRCIVVMPEKMSAERVYVLQALGAEIVRTPDDAPFFSAEGLIGRTQRLLREIPNSIVLNQCRNPGNPVAHYETTALEILEQCDGKLDMVVISAGTGGTLTGIGRRFKEKCPSCKVIGVDPEGSALTSPVVKPDFFCELEGIGYPIIATTVDMNIVDKWWTVTDQMAFPMAKRLIREEGILCGGTAGAVVAVAVKAAADLKEGQKCVVILPDGVRNYLTKFVTDQWMEVRNFQPTVNTMNHWWWDDKVSVLNLDPPISIPPTTSCEKTLNMMKKLGLAQIAVVTQDRQIVGVATLKHLMTRLFNAKVKGECPIIDAVVKKFIKVHDDTHLGLVSRALDAEGFVVVTKGIKPNEELVGLISPTDFLPYITSSKPDNNVCGRRS